VEGTWRRWIRPSTILCDVTIKFHMLGSLMKIIIFGNMNCGIVVTKVGVWSGNTNMQILKKGIESVVGCSSQARDAKA